MAFNTDTKMFSQDLSDIVLHFISGHHPENDLEGVAEKKTSPGLPLLEDFTLPDR